MWNFIYLFVCLFCVYVEFKQQRNQAHRCRENRTVVARGEMKGSEEMGKRCQKLQTSSYKIIKSWDIMYSTVAESNS